jgi:cytochrome b561
MAVSIFLHKSVRRQQSLATGRVLSKVVSETNNLPPIWREDRLFSEQLFSIHRLIGVAVAALVTAHISDALVHRFAARTAFLCA